MLSEHLKLVYEMALASKAMQDRHLKDYKDPDRFFGKGEHWFLHLSNTKGLNLNNLKITPLKNSSGYDIKPRGGFWAAARTQWTRFIAKHYHNDAGENRRVNDIYLYKVKINVSKVLVGNIRKALKDYEKDSEWSREGFRETYYDWLRLKREGLDVGTTQRIEKTVKQEMKNGKSRNVKKTVYEHVPHIVDVEGVWFTGGDIIRGIDVESICIFNKDAIKEIKYLGEYSKALKNTNRPYD